MSITQRRHKLQFLLSLLRHKQMQTTAETSKIMNCHSSTIQKMLKLLRKQGYQITYHKNLKKYFLTEEENEPKK